MRIIGAGIYFPEVRQKSEGEKRPYAFPRPVAGDNELLTNQAVEVSKQALAFANCKPSDIDLIISMSVTPDHLVESKDVAAPRLCHPLQRDLKADNAFVFDLIEADWATTIEVAQGFALSQGYKKILLVRAEITGPSIIPDSESGFAIADGAGAILLENEPDNISDTHFVSVKTVLPTATIAMLDPETILKGNAKCRLSYAYYEDRVKELNNTADSIISECNKDPLNIFQTISESWLPGHNINHINTKNMGKESFVHKGQFTLPFYATEILKSLSRHNLEEKSYKLLNLCFNPFLNQYAYNYLSI